MTRKTYKSAMGKTIDLGALILENEQVRAVGNMKVNARGDVLDSDNQVIDTKTKQVQRQYKKQTVNVSANTPISTGTIATRRAKKELDVENIDEEIVTEEVDVADDTIEEVVVEETASASIAPRGGLAAAIAKSKEVKQELLKTPRQLAQQAGVKKI
jgi:hypothetical protein